VKNIYLLLSCISFAMVGEAQDTFDKVYSIIQANCTGYCHNGGGNGPTNFVGSKNDVYNAIVDIDPINASALSKDYKLVDPGHPYKSFLLRKINNGLEVDRDIDSNEGDVMPAGGTGLLPEEIELISSWILHGAPETGNVVDEQSIIDYYNGLGMAPVVKPNSPVASEGVQIHFGSVYLAPGQEFEFFSKQKLDFINDTMEIDRIDAFMVGMSHHYIMYKYDQPSSANNVPEGIRPVQGFSTGFTNASMVNGWAHSYEAILPEGTAYFWEPNTVLDHNYHFLNYSPDSVLKAEVYLNIYMKPKGPETIQMFSDLYPNTSIFIPADGSPHTFSSEVFSNSNDSIFIYGISSHTHKYGVDYDIFHRDINGNKGSQVYEGYYDLYYNFNQGFYDWEHPPIRTFEPLLGVKANEGFIQEATYTNTGNTAVYWGLTTQDEMMLMGLQYTLERPKIEPQSIVDFNDVKRFSLYPQPAEDYVMIDDDLYTSYIIYDLQGKKIKTGSVNRKRLDLNKIPSGLYTLHLISNDDLTINKLIIK
jgi:hypothetical protein